MVVGANGAGLYGRLFDLDGYSVTYEYDYGQLQEFGVLPFDRITRQWCDGTGQDFSDFLNELFETQDRLKREDDLTFFREIETDLITLVKIAEATSKYRREETLEVEVDGEDTLDSFSSADSDEETEGVSLDKRIALAARMCGHDMGVPITVAQGYLEMYGKRLETANENVRRQLLVNSAHIRNVLSIARYIINGEPSLLDQISLNSMVDLLGKINRVETINKIKVDKQIYVDPLFYDALFQMERNAKDNLALGVSEKANGKIRVQFSYDGNAKILYATVTDKGTGISRKYLSNVFALDYSTKHISEDPDAELRMNRSNGLGLWLANLTARQHGGYISVQTTNEEERLFYSTSSQEVKSVDGGARQTGTSMTLAIPMVETETAIIPRMYAETYWQAGRNVEVAEILLQRN